MIKGLYETHIQVSDLKKSVQFYTEVLGLTLAHYDENRPIAFLWITADKKAMLGLWEQQDAVQPRHFAFDCDQEFILNLAEKFLKDHGLKPYNFLKNGSSEPMVFSWMPALALYFDDRDGNQLEFISMLEGEGQAELGLLTYADWLRLKK